jgi:NADH:ubiquinone oxidoreductase subunit K
MIPLNVPIVVSGVLFALGLLIFWIRRSFWASMISILFIWIGAIMNLAAMSHDGIGGITGQGAAVLLAILAGLEVCVALAARWAQKWSASKTSSPCD